MARPVAVAAAVVCCMWVLVLPPSVAAGDQHQVVLPPGLSLYHLVQGYPLEADLVNGADSLVSWPPSVALDQQTGFSQGSHGLVLTTGRAGQTVAWSVWGDGQATPNHWWFNVFDTTQARGSDPASKPAYQLPPCPHNTPGPTTCDELSAPDILTGGSHGVASSSGATNFTFDAGLNASLAFFWISESPAVVSLREQELAGGGSCVCVRDISPNGDPMLTVLDMAVDTTNRNAYLFGLSDNWNFFVKE
jgi:hypothetical protein